MDTTRHMTDAGAHTAPASACVAIEGHTVRTPAAVADPRRARRAGTAADRAAREAWEAFSAELFQDDGPAWPAPASEAGVSRDDWTALHNDAGRAGRLWEHAWQRVTAEAGHTSDANALAVQDPEAYQQLSAAAHRLRGRMQHNADRSRETARRHRAGMAVLAERRRHDEARRPVLLPEAPEAAAYPGEDGPPPAWSPPAEHLALTTCVLTAAPPAPASPETGARRAVHMAA